MIMSPLNSRRWFPTTILTISFLISIACTQRLGYRKNEVMTLENQTKKDLQIEYDEFKSLVNMYLVSMKNHKDFREADYLVMVRLWNTMTFAHLVDKDPKFKA